MTPEQIKRFLNKSCTAEEARHVADFLKKNPDIAEEYLPKTEFDNNDNVEAPAETWHLLWDSIKKRRRAKLVTALAIGSGVAAGIIGFLYIGFFNKDSSEPVKTTVAGQGTPSLQVISQEKMITNTGKTEKTIVLEDHSVVRLAPGAVVKYAEPFAPRKREITLTGSATFKVAKNQDKPFTVYAGAIATTALGTEFRVTQKNKTISVRLFSGKVVIRAVTGDLTGWQHDIYLLAGQEMNYDAKHVLVTKRQQDIAAAQKERQQDNNGILSFSNTPLSKVFEKLAKQYNTEIRFQATEIASKNFTGTIAIKDSLPVVLKIITQMNGLEAIMESDGYWIRPEQQNP